jgi:hypothetical protein
VLAIVAGIQVMRQMIALPALADADPADLQRVLAPIFRSLITGVADGTDPAESSRSRDN